MRQIQTIDIQLLGSVMGGSAPEHPRDLPLCSQTKSDPADSLLTRLDKAIKRYAWGCK
jgi:hypothetical protein